MTRLSDIQRGISRSGVIHAPYEEALFAELESAVGHYQRAPESLIQILHRAQELFGYLRDDVVQFISAELRLPISHVYGVIGFYSFFSTVPLGKHHVCVCTGTACYVRGADRLLRGVEKTLGVARGETTIDGRFSLRCARCVGACGLAPVMTIDDDVHSKIEVNRLRTILRQYK